MLRFHALHLAIACCFPLYSFAQQAATTSPEPTPEVPTINSSGAMLFNPSWQQGLLPVAGQKPDYWTGQAVSLGQYIFPHFHANGVIGSSTGEPNDLAVGHSDPRVDGFTFQGFELGTSIRAGDFEAFGNFHLGYDPNENAWEHEFEEAFVKWKNLGPIELRAGRFLNRLGLQNTLHLHGRDWADQYLLNGRFLGEDGLTTLGGEVNYYLPVRWTSLLSLSAGNAPEHEEEEHGREEEEHDEPSYEAEGAEWKDSLITLNWTNQANYNDFHQFRFGLSGAWGDNLWERKNAIYGTHMEYQWREDGFAITGKYLRWRTEAMWRRLGAVSGHLPGEEEEDEEGEEEDVVKRTTLNEVGVYSDLRYGWAADGWQLGLRGEYVGGIAEAGLEKRIRISPGVSYFFNPMRTVFLRVQYNYDRFESSRDEHSVWAQFGINWGGPEVR
jgi:hypothetical protein